MNAPATDRSGLGRESVGLLLALAAVLTVVDVVVARFLSGAPAWVLVGDLVAVAAFLVARRSVFVAMLVAVVASTAVTTAWLAAGGGRSRTLAGWPGLTELGVLALLMAWCIRNEPRQRAVVAAIAVPVAVVAMATFRVDRQLARLALLVLVVASLAVVATAVYLRAADVNRDVRARQARLDERAEISRELHDVVGHHVTGMVLQAQAAGLLLSDRPDLAATALSQIESAGADALASMRFMVRSLRSDEPAGPLTTPAATIGDLEALTWDTTTGSAPVRLHVDPAVASLPESVIASLHRIALESVTNARRHGIDVTAIDVRVRSVAGQIVLEVDNDGRPATASRSRGGFGLIGIGERVSAMGGRLTTGPRPDGGWSLRAEIPVAEGEAR